MESSDFLPESTSGTFPAQKPQQVKFGMDWTSELWAPGVDDVVKIYQGKQPISDMFFFKIQLLSGALRRTTQ